MQADEQRLAKLETQAIELRRRIDARKIGTGRPDPHALARYVGQRIREHREAQGIPQSRLAAMVKVDQANMVRLEHGRHLVRLDILIHLARVLDAKVEAFLP